MTNSEIREFKNDISSRLMELGNLLLAGILAGQVLGNNETSLYLIAAGLILGGLPYLMSYIIRF